VLWRLVGAHLDDVAYMNLFRAFQLVLDLEHVRITDGAHIGSSALRSQNKICGVLKAMERVSCRNVVVSCIVEPLCHRVVHPWQTESPDVVVRMPTASSFAMD